MDLRKKQTLFSFGVAVIVSICIITSLFTSINAMEKRDVQTERIVVLEKFLRFQSDSESIINESINLLEGYLTYIETNSDISEEDSVRYLDNLLEDKITIIKNIGIIKDTIITWNYPSEGNEKALGIDITTIPRQRDDALTVKEGLESVFIGPVNLIQGGTGFIARIPIIVNDGYWGQISLVLDGNQYLKQVENYSKIHGLNVAIYNEELFPTSPFYGDKDIVNRSGIVLDVKMLGEKWKVATEPIDGWQSRSDRIMLYKLLAVALSFIVGMLVYMLLNTRYKLKEQANHDNLTNLKNRNYLEYHYQLAQKRADDNDSIVGLFLLDINDFKKINDSYGHKIGDLVLKEFSKSLEELNVQNKKVFRLGGDEFLIVVSDFSDSKDFKYVDRLVRANSTFRFNRENVDFEVNSSVGFASYPDDGHELDEVMHVADSKMYVEKRKKQVF